MKLVSAILFTLLVACCLLPTPVSAVEHVDIQRICDVDKGEYFDVTILRCIPCITEQTNDYANKVPDLTKLGPRGNPISCTCRAGYIKVATTRLATSSRDYDIVPDFTCEACPVNSAPTEDKSRCMSCTQGTYNTTTNQTEASALTASSAIYDSISKECVCHGNTLAGSTTYYLREKDLETDTFLASKTCSPCPGRQYVIGNDLRNCHACPHPNMTLNAKGVCECDDTGGSDGFFEVGTDGLPAHIYGSKTCIPKKELNAWNFGSTTVKFFPNADSNSNSNSNSNSGGTNSNNNNNQNTNNFGQRSTSAPSGESFGPSLIFDHYLRLAVSKCAYYGSPDDSKYCEILANLCALNLFDKDVDSCKILDDIYSDRTKWTDEAPAAREWVKSVPWLKYSDIGEPAVIDTNKNLADMKIAIDAGTAGSNYVDRLNFTLAKYSLNGEFLGFEPLRTQFYYCNKKSSAYDSGVGTTSDGTGGNTAAKPTYGPPPTGDTRWLRYGYGYSETYYCDLESLIENNETIFYDLYLTNSKKSTDDVDALYPVPIRLENYVENNKLVNVNSDTNIEDDVFTRRFFLHDAITTIKQVGEKPEILRYADKIEIEIKMMQEGNAIKVSQEATLPPVVTIHYTDIKVEDVIGAKKTTQISFSVVYTQDTSTINEAIRVWAGLGYVTAIFVALIGSYGVYRKNSRLGAAGEGDGLMYVRMIVYIFAGFTKVFTLIIFIALLLIFLPFKDQVDLFILLPVDRLDRLEFNDYYKFRVFIVICFFGQLFKVIEIILQQTGVEIFFMDWEKTRGKLANTKDAKGKAQQAPISAWRTFFVANEWNELQSQRRINVPFTIVTMLFFLVGCGWQYHATRTPKMDDLTPAPIDPMLRFVNVAGLWLVVELIQIIFLDMIWLRFFAEYPESQFKDMCVIAKVSVFIMDEKYHGYYLHCRSPHEHADANMMEIDKDLQKMREELTVSDTMQGVPTDGNDNPLFDTFEVSVTREWREHYDVLYRKLKSTIRNKTQNDKGNMAIKFKTRKQVNKFLRAFVDNPNDSEYPRMTMDNSVQNWLCRVPPLIQNNQSILIGDKYNSFTKTLFLGVEFDLMLFNILTWAVVDLWAGDDTGHNHVLAAFITYLSNALIIYIRQELGQRNLHSKTMIDERFLF